MKKIYTLFLIFLTISFSFIFWHLKNTFVLADNIHSIEEKIIPSPVMASLLNDTNIYLDASLTKPLRLLKKGLNVEILEDRGTKVYMVKSNDENIKGWVVGEDLFIPETPKANKQYLKDSELEMYINNSGLSSKTDHLIFTDIYRQSTYIFKGSLGNWKIIKSLPCSTGLNISPTTRGIFEISDRGEWFFSERLDSGAMYWLRFNGSYLFHSVAMDKNKNIIDNTIGERCSSGCVRMNIDDIKWIYENIEKGTRVFIN